MRTAKTAGAPEKPAIPENLKVIMFSLVGGHNIVATCRAYGEDATTQHRGELIADNRNRVEPEQAYVVRTWGTKCGLGEIVSGGPTPSTVLDPIAGISVSLEHAVFYAECAREKWAKVFQ